MVVVKHRGPSLAFALVLMSLISTILYIGGIRYGSGDAFSYMLWNLFLAWIPLGLSLWLRRILRKRSWRDWRSVVLSLVWLGFLPNSFYMVSDYIHLQESAQNAVVYDAVMFTSFALTGLLLGFTSLYIIDSELRRRFSIWRARGVVAAILLLSGFAIYLGRYLRWNTWDILVDPAGLLFDVSNRVIAPWSYPRMIITTGVFFLLLMTLYVVMRSVASTLRSAPTE